MSRGCLLIHGFTGSPKEVEILAKHIEKKGVQVSTPTLAGHGEDLDRKRMKKVSWKEWLKTAEDAMIEMIDTYDEVYLIGFSMGGVIAAHLATKYPIKKLVLLSASVFYINPKTFIRDLREKPFTKDQVSRYLYKIKGTPLKATINFRKLVKELSPSIGSIDVPILIIQGEKDDLVDPKSADYIYRNVKSKEKYIHLLPKSKHMVCWDCERETVVDLVDTFLFSKEGKK